MGLSLDESTALFANMAAAGIETKAIMPGLSTAMQKMSKEGVTDMSVGLSDLIASIQNAGTETEAMAIATDAFGAGAGVRFKDAIRSGALEFDTLLEARGLIERWKVHYNTVRLHSSLGYRPPAPEAVLVTSHSNQITT